MIYNDIELVTYTQDINEKGNGVVLAKFKLWLDNRNRCLIRIINYEVKNWVHNFEDLKSGTVSIPMELRNSLTTYLNNTFSDTITNITELHKKWLLKRLKNIN